MANKSTRSVQVPVEVKLEVANQTSVMKDLLRDLQDTFGGVDLSSSLGKNLNKAFNQITKKLGTIDGYLGKELFVEGDLIKTANLSEQIAVCFRDIERYVKSTSVKNFALSDADLRRIEQAEAALENIYKAKAADRSKGIGAVLKAGDADLKRFTSRQKETGFDSTKTFGANKKALEKTAITLGQSVDTLDEAFSQAQNSVDSFTEILNKAKAEVSTARGKRDQKAQELAQLTSQNEYYRVGQELKSVKTHGVKKDEAIKQFQDILDKQLDISGNFIAGGESFAKIFAEWINFDDIEGLMSQSAQEIVTTLKNKLADKMREGLSVYTFENKAKGTQQVDITKAQAELVEAERVYNQVSNNVTDAQADLNEAITKRNDAETNLKQAQDLLNEVQSQITRLIELREQYEATIDQTYDGQINDAKKHAQQVRDEVRKPYDNTVERNRGGADTSSGNTRVLTDKVFNENQTKQQREQEAEDFRKSLQEATRHWMSASQIISYIKDGIRQAWQDIQGLDKAMTNIAVVTDMSVSDLWGKINEYMAIAQQYGVTTQGVYEVSQLYYQQGLSTNEVMEATTETLKLARIAGMDYAEAADAMTVAIRSFKMEMSDAQRVTDVYSKVAAITASDSEELAVAMSKTASSAESVGSSFENTTAMLAVMVETTRESAQNLGSALKSIISRYGEMKTGVTIDSEGEAIDYNKVDTALQSIGISLKDAQGQFRDFDDVIFELSASWDSLDKNTQRYIATIMAGNRQQSRFIALVDNWERLDEVSKAATDADDAGLLQYAKTMDSLETKINTVSNSFQQFYMSAFNGDFFKGALDIVNNIITSLSKVGPLLGGIQLIQLITQIKNIGSLILNGLSGGISKIKSASEAWKNEFTNAGWEPVGERIGQIIANGIASKAALATQQVVEQSKLQTQDVDTLVGNITNNDLLRAQAIYDKKDGASPEEIQLADSITQASLDLKKNLSGASEEQRKAAIETYTKSIEAANKLYEGAKKGGEAVEKSGKNFWAKAKEFSQQHAQGIHNTGKGLYAAGTALSMYGITMDQTDYDSYVKSNWIQGGGSALTGLGQILTGDKIGGVITLITGAVTAIKRISQLDEVRLESLTKKAEEANIERAEKREEARNLQSTIDNLKKLQAARYKSEEAEQAFIEASNTAAEQFPGLIQGYDETGNAIIDVISNTAQAEYQLAEARKAAAEATITASAAEVKKNKEQAKAASKEAESVAALLTTFEANFLGSIDGTKEAWSDYSGYEAYLRQHLGIETRDNTGALLEDYAYLKDYSDIRGTELFKTIAQLLFLEEGEEIPFDIAAEDWEDAKSAFVSHLTDYAAGLGLSTEDGTLDAFSIIEEFEKKLNLKKTADISYQTSQDAYIRDIINKGFQLGREQITPDQNHFDNIYGLETLIKNQLSNQGNWTQFFDEDGNFDSVAHNDLMSQAQKMFAEFNEAFSNTGVAYIENYNDFLKSAEQGNLAYYEIGSEINSLIEKAQKSENQELETALLYARTSLLDASREKINNLHTYLASLDESWNKGVLFDIAPQYFDELLIFADSIENKIASGMSELDADEMILGFEAFYYQIQNVTEAKDLFFKALADGSIFTASGQATLLAGISDITGEQYSINIPVYAENLITSYAQLESKVGEKLSSLIEIIDSASDGLDIDKAISLASKVEGKSVGDLFEYANGKYFIKDDNTIDELIKIYYQDTLTSFDALNTVRAEQIALLNKSEDSLDDKESKELEQIRSQYENLFDGAKGEELDALIIEYLNNELIASTQEYENLYNQMTQEAKLSLAISQKARNGKTAIQADAAQILASTGGLGLSEEDVKTIAIAFGKDIEWIKEQLILNSDGTFDISNINSLNLSSLNDENAANSIRVKRAVEESNLADNIEDSLVGMYDNIAEVSLEDLTTLYKDITKEDADANTLRQFQKALDEARNGSYVSLIKVVNELRQIAEEKGIEVDNSLIDATIKDAQLALVASVLSVLDSGLTGDLGFVEYNEFLRNNLHINASEGSEEWARWQKYVYETNDGLKFTNAGVSAIYAELGKIAPMAQQAFIETVADGQKQYETLGSTLEYIEELTENINKANSEADDTKRKQYEAELEIAQKIFEIRSEDPDQFNFMSRDIRDGIQAPTNMWENAGQAAEVLRQATTDGYMAAEDFWRMAETTNEYLSLSGKEFTLGMGSYAEAMEAAAKHTKVVGDELVIDFGAMGLNIETAMGDMANGLDEGIKAMAEEQIKLLDAQISMLEGFQALEELSGEEILADGIIEASEIFDSDFKDFTEEGKNFVDRIKEILQQVLGDGFKGTDFDAMLKEKPELAADFLNDWVEFLATGETSPQAMEAFVRKWMLDYSEAFKNEAPAAPEPEPEYTSLQDKRKADLQSGRVIEEGFSGKALNENPNIETTDTIALKSISNDVSSIAASVEAQKGKELSAAEENGIAISNNVGKIVTLMEEQRKGETLSSIEEKGPAPYEIGEGLEAQALARILAERDALYAEAANEQEQRSRIAERRQEAVYLQNQAREAQAASLATADLVKQEEQLQNVAILSTGTLEQQAEALETVREEEAARIETLNLLKDITDEPADVQVDYSEVDEASSAVDKLFQKIKTPATIDIRVNFPNKYVYATPARDISANPNASQLVHAKGNVALAGGRGTLMGELGPELYVQNGHYYIAGAHGAEFVDLADDAIVFNHLQTRRIMGAGSINGRGTPVVSESKSVSFATGNADGRAMAIGDVINKLKQQREMWQSIIDNMSVSEMVGGGGSSKGGGGSGNSIKAVTEELQEWYNLSRQIADIEQEINNIIAERENITDGGEYLKSLREQEKLLNEQSRTQEVLLRYQQLQLQRQADFINQNKIWSQFLEVDENGLLQYIEGNETNGGKGALKVLQELNDMSGEQQLAFLQRLGYSYTDNDGNALEGEDLIQMFFEELQSQIDQYDNLYDTVHETESTLEELESSVKEINDEIKQNQMDLEEAIYDIIVSSWEAEISQMEKQAELIKEANEEYINGLNEALSAERDMYSENDSIAEREQLQRRLSLLRRSGGSASEIADLEQQLDDMLRDEYFNKQEQMIENIQNANEEQVRLLEQQITMQEEALQYQKENGVIWTKVYEVMSGTEAEILEFMQGNYVEFFAQSLLQQESMLTDWAKKIGIYNEDKVYNRHADYARKQIWDTEGIWSQGSLAQYRGVYDSLTAEQKANLRETHASTYASTMMESDDFDTANAAATQVVYDYLKQIKAQQDAAQTQPPTTTPSTGGSSGSGSSSTDVTHWTFTYNGTKYYHYKDKASAEKRLRELYQNDYSKAEMNDDLAGMTLSGQRYSKALGTLKSGPHSKGYSTGGLVDYTGTAIVHGSKSRPEAFLNAEQTAQIRDALRNSGKDNILDNIRTAVWQLKEHFASLTTKNNNEYNVSIAPGAVVIQVEQLNDAYDIEEISNDVMNRMTAIAAKATNRGVNRR